MLICSRPQGSLGRWKAASDPEIRFGIITKNAGKQVVSHALAGRLAGRLAGSPGCTRCVSSSVAECRHDNPVVAGSTPASRLHFGKWKNMPFDFHADAQAGRDVAKALGFDPHGMVEINLKFRAGDLLVVTTEQLVPAEKLPKVTGEIVKRKYIVNCVAEPTEQRHDAGPCSGERQEPDVGEGWRELGADEMLQDGDEVNNGLWGWGLSLRLGLKAGTELRYRRRVTPVPPAPELSAAAVSAMCQRNERDALLKKIATLRSEAEQQQEIIMHAGLEIADLTAEVERLRTENALLRCGVESLTAERDNLEFEAKVLRDERKARLGGGE